MTMVIITITRIWVDLVHHHLLLATIQDIIQVTIMGVDITGIKKLATEFQSLIFCLGCSPLLAHPGFAVFLWEEFFCVYQFFLVVALCYYHVVVSSSSDGLTLYAFVGILLRQRLCLMLLLA